MQFSSIFLRNISWTDLENRHQELLKQVQQDPTQAYLLFSEPRATYTYGRSASASELLWSQNELEKRQIEVHSVSRGGRWTFHGPGQVLVYPVVALRQLKGTSLRVRWFMESFRKALVEPLLFTNPKISFQERPFGIRGEHGKLGSFGLAVSRGVVHHGAAIYLESQSLFFKGIHPCGVVSAPVSSLREEGFSWDWDETAKMIEKSLKSCFEFPQKGIVYRTNFIAPGQTWRLEERP